MPCQKWRCCKSRVEYRTNYTIISNVLKTRLKLSNFRILHYLAQSRRIKILPRSVLFFSGSHEKGYTTLEYTVHQNLVIEVILHHGFTLQVIVLDKRPWSSQGASLGAWQIGKERTVTTIAWLTIWNGRWIDSKTFGLQPSKFLRIFYIINWYRFFFCFFFI